MKCEVIWEITAYDIDVFLWKQDQEPFRVEAEKINDAIKKAEAEAGKRFSETYHAGDYSQYKVIKLIDENGIEYPI